MLTFSSMAPLFLLQQQEQQFKEEILENVN